MFGEPNNKIGRRYNPDKVTFQIVLKLICTDDERR